MREIYEGDSSLMTGWPFGWWGLEPFSKDHPDWRIRYASVFRLQDPVIDAPNDSKETPDSSMTSSPPAAFRTALG